MAVATKHRRKLTRNGRLFVWFAAEDDDSTDMVLQVISDDGRFKVRYVLGQKDEGRLLIVLGREFAGASTGGCWTRFHCPCFDPHGVISPSGVRRLIDWCLAADHPRQPLECGKFAGGFYGTRPDVEAFTASNRAKSARPSEPSK
jgi:hypothetical protein